MLFYVVLNGHEIWLSTHLVTLYIQMDFIVLIYICIRISLHLISVILLFGFLLILSLLIFRTKVFALKTHPDNEMLTL